MSFQGNINNHKVADISIDDYIRNKELKLGIDAYTKILVELKEKKEISEDEFFYYKEGASEEEKKTKVDKYYNDKEKTMRKFDINIGAWEKVQASKYYKEFGVFSEEYMIQTSYEVREGKPLKPTNIPLAKSLDLKETIKLLKELKEPKGWAIHIRILKKIIELNK